MFDDLGAHFHEHLVPLYVRYREIREEPKAGLSRDLQAATAASNALYHFREHLPPSHAMSRAEVATLCSDYDLVGDIANVSKHAELSRGAPKVSHAQSVSELIVLTEFSDEEGTFTDARKLVTVKLDDGTEREIFDILTNVINFWGQQLLRWGVLRGYNLFPLPEPPGSRSLSREEARGLDLEMIQGVRFKMQQRLQRYNPSKGCSEPIDLTGSKLTFRIYKPTVKLDAVFTHNETGEKRRFSIDLTREQAEVLQALQSEDEKQAFVRKLLAKHTTSK